MDHLNSAPEEQSGLPRHCKVLVVGGGISGICLGVQLRKQNIDDFIILEKSLDAGGTWLNNTYPGCGCDVPSLLYSFSFKSNVAWTRKYAPQPEILQYFRDCIDHFSVTDHFRFGVSVASARWDDTLKQWFITTDSGETISCDYFVSAVGQLSRPSVPTIEGLDLFDGSLFHSAQWPREFKPQGLNIGVVGNGASAIQIVPELAKSASSVKIFQRSPNWILPRHDHRYGVGWKFLNRYMPFCARIQRLFMYLAFEMRILFYNRRTFLNKAFTGWTRYRMRRKVPSQLTHELIPSFPAGCKRVLLSNNFLESLHRPNVELITERIDKFTASGVKTKSRSVSLDAIVMATGFETHRFLYPIEVTGKEGSSLTQRWKQRPQTYLGMLVPDFPNFCMLYGPNTNLGHNSVIFMVECQVNYLMQLIKLTEASKADCFEVTPEATTDFDNRLQQQLGKKVWNGYAKNWYTNEQGYITNNWCRSTLAYMWQTRRVKKSALRFSSRPCTKTADATPNVC